MINKPSARPKQAGSSSFVRSTAVMALGSTAAQAITLLLTPVITRLFTPDAFGIFATILALSGPFIAISTLRYHDAIMLPKSERAARAVFRLSLCMVILSVLILTVVVVVAGHNIGMILELGGRSELLYAVPALVLLVGARRVFDAWLQRTRMFSRIAGVTIGGAVIDRAVTIGAGLGNATPWTLIAGRVSGLASSIILMLGAGRKRSIEPHEEAVEFSTMREAAARYASFARYSWSGLVLQLSRELPVLVFGAVFSASVAGLFVLARRVLMEPAILVGEALSKTFFERAANLKREGKRLDTLTRSLVEYLMRWSIPPMAMFAVAAPEIFQIVFGEQWREAGVYAILLMPIFFAGFIMQSLSRLFNVLEKQKAMAGFSLLDLGGIIIGLAIGLVSGDARVMCGVLSLMVLSISSIKAAWICRRAGLQLSQLLPVVSRSLGMALVWTIPLLGIKYGLAVTDWMLAVATVAFCAAYIGYIALKDKHLRRVWQS